MNCLLADYILKQSVFKVSIERHLKKLYQIHSSCLILPFLPLYPVIASSDSFPLYLTDQFQSSLSYPLTTVAVHLIPETPLFLLHLVSNRSSAPNIVPNCVCTVWLIYTTLEAFQYFFVHSVLLFHFNIMFTSLAVSDHWVALHWTVPIEHSQSSLTVGSIFLDGFSLSQATNLTFFFTILSFILE